MKLLKLDLKISPFGHHYLYATYEGESGKTFTPSKPYMWAYNRDMLEEKLSYYPESVKTRISVAT